MEVKIDEEESTEGAESHHMLKFGEIHSKGSRVYPPASWIRVNCHARVDT